MNCSWVLKVFGRRLEATIGLEFSLEQVLRTRRKMATDAPSLSNKFSTGFQRVFMLVLLLLLFQAQVGAQNPRADVQTLLKFKAMIDVQSPAVTGGYWGTWNDSDETPCDWDGIICTSRSTVEQINLSPGPAGAGLGWRLEVLPALGVLSNLTDLRQLDLSSNLFKNTTSGGPATIPDDIGSLIGLTHLDLSGNGLVGPIPQTISDCKNLRQISLGQNALSGEIPDLSGLEKLQYLLLSGNNLSGPIPTWLGKLNSPLTIDLSDNSLNSTIPSLPNLSNLLELFLDNNSLTGFEGALFPDATSLEHLTISGNQLSGPIPPSITRLLNLKTLDLSRNNLSGPVPSEFALNMSNAIWIELSYNQLTGGIPGSLLQPTARSSNLPGVKMSHNCLNGNIPLDGTKDYNYYAIDFSYNDLSGPINFSSICNNGGTLINSLYLQNNSLSGDIVDFLAQCHGYVGDMRLANNSFSGDLSRMVNISNPGASTKACYPQGNPLCVLDLSNNDLQMSTTEAYPDPLRAVLERLVLNTSLTQFLIPGNNFSRAPLPSSFTLSAESLQVLDLSGNHLIGEISSAAFNSTWLPALQSFSLANNDITGPIPEALVIIPSLTLLDVANNSLSGPLPTQLPNGLFNLNFFAGNGGLCGGPLQSCSRGGGHVQWWVLLLVVGGSVIIGLGSCLAVTWRLKVYQAIHQQDADLIKTLLERESASLMSRRELTKATNNFAESFQIGAGGFGVVYAGKLNDGTIVAIKRSKHEGSQKDKNRFLNEVRILSQVNHRHLVKLLGCCMENKATLLVFEFISNGTLQEHLQGKIGLPHGLTWEQRLRIAIQTADALNYLHSATTYPIYHRDVKSANILLDGDLNAKVSDFGISRLAPLKVTHVSTVAEGTIGYIDPEYYTSYQLTDKSDVYGFGVVLLELISAKPAIDFARGGDQTGLVNFASVYIESGDLQPLLDVALLETYNDSATNGRDSILSLGRLAMECLHLRSKARPGMHEVWKDLQNIWHEYQGTSKDLGSSIEEDGKAPKYDIDNILFLSDSFSNCSSDSSNLPFDCDSIQMSQLCELSRVR